jgi:hypothetical protein
MVAMLALKWLVATVLNDSLDPEDSYTQPPSVAMLDEKLEPEKSAVEPNPRNAAPPR